MGLSLGLANTLGRQRYSTKAQHTFPFLIHQRHTLFDPQICFSTTNLSLLYPSPNATQLYSTLLLISTPNINIGLIFYDKRAEWEAIGVVFREEAHTRRRQRGSIHRLDLLTTPHPNPNRYRTAHTCRCQRARAYNLTLPPYPVYYLNNNHQVAPRKTPVMWMHPLLNL